MQSAIVFSKFSATALSRQVPFRDMLCVMPSSWHTKTPHLLDSNTISAETRSRTPLPSANTSYCQAYRVVFCRLIVSMPGARSKKPRPPVLNTHRGPGLLWFHIIPHNSKCRYGERGATAAKPKAQIILDVLSSILATQMPCRSRRSGA